MDSYKLTLEICRAVKSRHSNEVKREDPVVFKVDGGRFDQEKTVKLGSNAGYVFKLTFSSPVRLTSATLSNHTMSIEQVKDTDDENTYRVHLPAHTLTVSKAGQRQQMELNLETEGNREINIPFQVKVYRSHSNSHCQWGSELHKIEIECRHRAGSSPPTYDILDMVYR